MRAANAGWGVYIERRGVVTWPSERLRVARETLKAVCCRIGGVVSYGRSSSRQSRHSLERFANLKTKPYDMTFISGRRKRREVTYKLIRAARARRGNTSSYARQQNAAQNPPFFRPKPCSSCSPTRSI